MYELDVVSPSSLGRFVYRWYGPPDRPPMPLDDPGVPAPLLEWHRLAARYTYPLSRDHAMLPLTGRDVNEHDVTECDVTERDRNGTVRFWQGADDWYSYDCGAFRAGIADPEVIENDELPTGLTLSRFLVYAAVYEATYAPLHGLVYMNPEPEELRAVKVRLRELEDSLWRWPDPQVVYYGDDDLLGHLGPDRIVLAGRHRDALGRFDGLALPWDWDTRTL
ncbi:hypothetical protein ABT297_09855 [Dactylosporangium sp. NPDC000555]|uniref:hypothetical protein n=1 Tax=Dactylosporangium sp. NPDC000555 TaxID=3154260 RepID=UPI003329928B